MVVLTTCTHVVHVRECSAHYCLIGFNRSRFDVVFIAIGSMQLPLCKDVTWVSVVRGLMTKVEHVTS